MIKFIFIVDSTTVSFLAMNFYYVGPWLHVGGPRLVTIEGRRRRAGGTETGHNEPFYGVHTQSFEFTTAIRYRTYLRQRQTFGNYIATAC